MLQAWGCPVTLPCQGPPLAAAGGPACSSGGSHGWVGCRIHCAGGLICLPDTWVAGGSVGTSGPCTSAAQSVEGEPGGFLWVEGREPAPWEGGRRLGSSGRCCRGGVCPLLAMLLLGDSGPLDSGFAARDRVCRQSWHTEGWVFAWCT